MLGKAYLADVNQRFHDLKRLGDNALAQVSDHDFFVILDPESNSVAILLKHVAGNMRSRWSDLFVSDGEKTDRDRDSEFVMTDSDGRGSIVAAWESGWNLLFSVVGNLQEDKLMATVTVRGEPHLLIQAINRQLTHCSYHVGQIVFLAKHFASSNWRTLSVARRVAARAAEKTSHDQES